MVIATRYLNPGEIQELETAIASVEQETSAEIVCAVATESGRYDRPEAMVGILFAVVSLLLFNLAVPYGGTKVETPAAGEERGGVAVGWTDVESLHVSVQVLSLVLGLCWAVWLPHARALWHAVRQMVASCSGSVLGNVVASCSGSVLGSAASFWNGGFDARRNVMGA